MTEARRFERQGLLAIDPRAFWDLFFMPPEPPPNRRMGDVEIVTVRGPLEFHAGGWCDSYDSIVERVKAACATDAKAVCVVYDSPGGDLAGMIEASRAMRTACREVGKRLGAYVEGTCASAAYALASSADVIMASQTALVGSIGVVSSRLDWSEMNAKNGIRVVVTGSGVRKADGHPDVPISDEEISAAQSLIGSLARSFADLVSEHRGVGADDVLALEAGVFTGPEAVAKRLTDRVASLGEMLAELVSDAPMEQQTMTTKASKYEEGRAALEEAAKGEGEEADKAKRALKAMDEKPEEEEAKAEGDGKDKDEMPFDPKKGDDEEEKKDKAASRAELLALSREFAGESASPSQLRAAAVYALKCAVENKAASPPVSEAVRIQAIADRAELAALRETVARLEASAKADASAKRTAEINAYIDEKWRAAGRVTSEGKIALSDEDRTEIVEIASSKGDGWKKPIDAVLRQVNLPPQGTVSNPDAKTPKGGVPMTQREALDIVFNRLRAAQTDEERAKPNSAAPLRRKASQLAPKEFPELWRTESPAAE